MTSPNEQQRVDVIAVMEESARLLYLEVADGGAACDALLAAKVRVAELIEAAKVALGEHTAPHDCYAIGPVTGDPYLDLVRCPGCRLAAALANVGAAK